jgi:hypothetical protein
MSVANPIPGEVFTITTIKYNVGNPAEKWSNIWEVQAKDGGSPDLVTLQGVKDTIIEFEKEITRPNTAYDSSRISTWAQEPDYDPQSFITQSETGTGLIGGTTDQALPAEVCLFIRKVASYGRQGKLFIRQYLGEDSVRSTAGQWMLESLSADQAFIATAVAAVGLDQYLGTDSPNPNYQLVMAGRTKFGAEIVRPIVEMTAAGVSTVKLSRRWYNRRASGSQGQ